MDVIASSACYLDEFMWMLGEKKKFDNNMNSHWHLISKQYPLYGSLNLHKCPSCTAHNVMFINYSTDLIGLHCKW